MDYYQRIFNETRPVTVGRGLPANQDLKEMIDSEWLRTFFRGIKSYEQQNLNAALNYLDQAISGNNNDNPHLFMVRANIKEDMSNFNGAIADYKKALFISGSDWYATYNQIAINFLNMKNFFKALTAFDIAIELKLQLVNDKLDESILPYTQDGVVIRVDFERIYTNRANVKLSLKDFVGCEKDSKNAIVANPDYSNAYFILGLLYINLARNDQAYKYFKLAQAKGHPHATNILNQYF